MKLYVVAAIAAILDNADADQTGSVSTASSLSVQHMYYNIASSSSSMTIKENVMPLDIEILASEIDGIEPIQYTLIKDANETQRLHIGFIAEDMPERIQTFNDDKVVGINTMGLLTMMYAKIMSQDALIKAQDARITALEDTG